MRKKLLFIGSLLFVIVFLASCVVKLDQKPVFHGVDDITIEKGSTFLPLEGVTVTDKEDGTIDVSAITVDASKVNVNVVGEYIVKYSVTDSYGNTTEVERKVKVVYSDTTPPVLFGVNNVEVFLGDETFTPLLNVSAEDNVDGDVTSSITYTGEVNVWQEGEYTINYTVKDAANNTTVKERKVYVNMGDFMFFTTDEIQGAFDGKMVQVEEDEPTVSKIFDLNGGVVNQPYYFTYVKVVFKASSTVNKNVTLSLTGADTATDPIEIISTMTEYVKIFRISEPLEEAELAFTFESGEATVTFETVKMYFAAFSDEIAPVVEIVENKEVYVPVDAPEALVVSELLKGVTAFDNMEGNMTSKLVVDLSEVDLSVAGTYEVSIKATDSFGNVGTLVRTLVVARAYDTGIITDPTFDGTTNAQFVQSTSGDGVISMSFVDGQLVANITQAGNWGSANSPYISGLTTDKLEAGFYYLFKMDIKGTKDRRIAIRSGLELWASPWMEDFGIREPKFWVRTEWTTIYYIFYVHANQSAVGSKSVKFEIHLGAIDYNSSESGNTIYIDNAQFYKLTNVNETPVISLVPDMPKTLTKGTPSPDFKTYFKATDLEDGSIIITDDMLDLGGFDINVPGVYEIKCTVKDSLGAEVSEKITITVIEDLDTEGPVITIDPMALAMLNAMMPVKQGTDLTNTINSLANYITIVDNVDGPIPFALSMVNFDGLTYANPQPGVYNVKVSTKDSSGNDSNVLVLTITVSDGEAPKFVGVANKKLYVGNTFDPFEGVRAYDNVDGTIYLTLDHVDGLDQFLDETGKVTTAGQFQVVYTVKDAAGNEAIKTVIFTVEAEEPDFYDGAYIDLISKISWLSKGSSTSVLTRQNGQAIVDYTPGNDWWASAVHIKCDGNVGLVSGATYKLIIEASVEIPRDILINFFKGSTKISGFENAEDHSKLRIGLVDGGYIYEYIFTVTNTDVGGCTFEIDLGWESTLVNPRVSQQIIFKQIKLISTNGVIGTRPEDELKEVVLEDFEDYADDAAFQASTSDVVVGFRIGTGSFVKSNGQLVVGEDNNYVQQNFAYSGGSVSGIRIKIKKADIPADMRYIAIWMQASTIDKVNKFQAFVYNSSNANTEISSTLVGGIDTLVDGMYVYIPVSSLKDDTVELSLQINVNTGATGTLKFDNISLVNKFY